jgi:hypothetical protein
MSIKTNVAKFITGTTARTESIVALKASFKGKSEAVVRTALLPIVAADKRYNVPVVASERPKFAGEMVMDRESKNYETARSMLSDMVSAIVDGKKPSFKYEFTRKQRSAAKVYLALFASAAEAKAALTA